MDSSHSRSSLPLSSFLSLLTSLPPLPSPLPPFQGTSPSEFALTSLQENVLEVRGFCEGQPGGSARFAAIKGAGEFSTSAAATDVRA